MKGTRLSPDKIVRTDKTNKKASMSFGTAINGKKVLRVMITNI